MAEEMISITIDTTYAELTALEIAAQVYLDLLEVVEPLKPDRMRLEVINQLVSFEDRCRETKGQGQAPIDAIFPMQIPFKELMVVVTSIDAYEFMDKICCLPADTSGLTPIDVIMLTRRFQRRIVSTPSGS